MILDAQKKMSQLSLGRLFPELSLVPPMSDILVKETVLDSRNVKAGDLFIALSGSKINGEAYIDDAIRLGAVAIAIQASTLVPVGTIQLLNGVPILAVEKLADRVSYLAGLCLDGPSKKLITIGVTGTNGKSTSVSLIAQLFQLIGGSAASMGTLGLEINGVKSIDFGMTTPDAATCQKSLAYLVEHSVQLVAMEVSSHGLAQNRVAAVEFDVAVFTNLTHDHLDYHGTLQAYRKAKQKLFQQSNLTAAVINLDDTHSQKMVATAKKKSTIYTYSLLHFVADVYASNVVYSDAGVEFMLTTPWGTRNVKSPLLGQFNVYNLMAAITSLCAKGVSFADIVAVIPKLQPVLGRMQVSKVASDINVIVDYAHTPDALSQAIEASRSHTQGMLWVVFGCGGDRDALKRPLMGSIAEQLADRIIVTNDNPRTEAPDVIIENICSGFTKNNHVILPDRMAAIRFAVSNAKASDTVLIAGKGHENYQIIGRERFDFDDMAIAGHALSMRDKSSATGVISQ